MLLCALAMGCSRLAAPALDAPDYEPTDQAKSRAHKTRDKPLVIEWPSAERAELEARMKHGTVVVQYNGEVMRMLPACKAPGSYAYTAVTPKHEALTITNEDELHATLPFGAARFEGELASSGSLKVDMTLVGRYAATDDAVAVAGDCRGATHVISAATVGAFKLYAGADARGDASFIGMGAGSRAEKTSLAEDGDKAACSEGNSDAPPDGCRAILRVELVRVVTPHVVDRTPPQTTPPHTTPPQTTPPQTTPPQTKPAKHRTRPEDTGETHIKISAPPKLQQKRMSDDPAERELEESCENGNTNACIAVAERRLARAREARMRGRVIPFDIQHPLWSACTAGDMRGCTMLGTAHRDGHGAPADFERGVTLYRHACARRHRPACHALRGVGAQR